MIHNNEFLLLPLKIESPGLEKVRPAQHRLHQGPRPPQKPRHSVPRAGSLPHETRFSVRQGAVEPLFHLVPGRARGVVAPLFH